MLALCSLVSCQIHVPVSPGLLVSTFLPGRRTLAYGPALRVRTCVAARRDSGLGGASVGLVYARSALDELFQLVRIGRTLHCGFQCDLTFLIERRQRLVECLHPEFILTGLHHRIDLMDLVFADKVANSRIRYQYLKRHYPAV